MSKKKHKQRRLAARDRDFEQSIDRLRREIDRSKNLSLEFNSLIESSCPRGDQVRPSAEERRTQKGTNSALQPN